MPNFAKTLVKNISHIYFYLHDGYRHDNANFMDLSLFCFHGLFHFSLTNGSIHIHESKALSCSYSNWPARCSRLACWYIRPKGRARSWSSSGSRWRRWCAKRCSAGSCVPLWSLLRRRRALRDTSRHTGSSPHPDLCIVIPPLKPC